MITASMPSVQHPSVFGAGAHDGALTSTSGAQDTSPRVILPLLPHVSREPTHQDSIADLNRVDPGCMYSQGDVLYSNSAIVMARLAEIKQASKSSTDLRTIESLHFPEDITANQNGEFENTKEHSRSPIDSGLSPLEAEVVVGEGGINAPGRDAFSEIEVAKDSAETVGTRSNRSGHRQSHPAGLSPPAEAIPKCAEPSGTISPESTKW